jgi:hypothetical protein
MYIVMVLAVASIETDMLYLSSHHFPATPPTPASVLGLYIPAKTVCSLNNSTDLNFDDAVKAHLECHFVIENTSLCANIYIGPAADRHVGLLRVDNNRWDVPNALMGAVQGTTLTEATVRVIARGAQTRLCPCVGVGHSCYVPTSLPPICVPDAFNVPTEDGVEGVVLALTAGVALVVLVATNIVGAA